MLFVWGGMRVVPCLEARQWSTSFLEKGGNLANPPKKRELVVHFGKWTTGFQEKGRNPAIAPK